MEESFIKKYLLYLAPISAFSIGLGVLVQLKYLGENTGYFSFTNVINDSIILVLIFISSLLGIIWGIFIGKMLYKAKIKLFLQKYNKSFKKYYSINIKLFVITLCLLMCFSRDIPHIFYSPNISFVYEIMGRGWTYAMFSTFIFINLIELWKNKNNLQENKYENILCLNSIVAAFLALYTIIHEKGFIFIITVLLVLLFVKWINQGNLKSQDYDNLLSFDFIKFYAIIIIGLLFLTATGRDLLLFQNKCFTNNQGEQIQIKYMNDKYIFTNSGSEIYKNDIDKFYNCDKS